MEFPFKTFLELADMQSKRWSFNQSHQQTQR